MNAKTLLESRIDFARTIGQSLGTILGPLCECVLVKGSVLREDEFIPGYSDLDLHAFISSEIMRAPGILELDWALRVQRAVAPYDVEALGFSALQLVFIDRDKYPEHFAPPPDRSYRVLVGLPPRNLPRFDGRHEAGRAIERLRQPSAAAMLVGRIADKDDKGLRPMARLAGTYLKGAVYSAGMASMPNPEDAIRSPIAAVVEHISPLIFPRLTHASAPLPQYFAELQRWSLERQNPFYLREQFRRAIESLDAIEAWARQQP